MTSDFPSMSKQVRRQALVTGLRILVIGAAILIILTPAPNFEVEATAPLWLLVLSGLMWATLFLVVFWWQLKRVWAANRPQQRMVEAIAVIFILFIGISGRGYAVLSQSIPDSFNQGLSYFDGLYLAMTVLTTVGFGDIVPLTTTARAVVMLQMAFNLVLLGFALRVITGVASKARDRKQKDSTQ
jgi:voltage-gated potassium channel